MLDRLAVIPSLAGAASTITPEEAAVEYSSVVLQIVPPYASLFLHESAMLNAEPAEEAQRDYLQADFEIDPAWRAGAADHLGLQLLFLAHLMTSAREDWRPYLHGRLLPWAPVCCLAIARIEESRLYAPLAALTLEVLRSLAAPDH